MTFRESLARYVRGLLEEPPTPPVSVPPTPSPESTPPTTTASSMTTAAASEAGLLAVVLQTMREMQTEQLRETREMVLSILQGRPMDPEQIAAMAVASEDRPPLKEPYDPPDYDSDDLTDLPEGIQSIFDRERQEVTDLRHLRTEREVLAAQLDEARAMLADPQGPASDHSYSTD